jgi:hypothetical protein
MREISIEYRELQRQKNRLFECQRNHTAALNRRYLYETDEAYKECTEALNEWDKQTELVARLQIEYTALTNKGDLSYEYRKANPQAIRL